MPVYATTVLGLSGWVTGAVFTINTVMVGFGQGLAVNRMTGVRRWRVLLLENAIFVVSYGILLGASWLPVAVASAVLLLGAAVYTLGELVGSPVHAALAAEAAPEHLRGRYLSLIQLAWNLAGTVAPVSFAWLLDRGPSAMWIAVVAMSCVGGLLAIWLGRVMPHAAQRITNRAEATATA
jgi:MFS family permease